MTDRFPLRLVIVRVLVLSLLVTPAAAAFRVTASPVLAPLLSTLFAVVSAVGSLETCGIRPETLSAQASAIRFRSS